MIAYKKYVTIQDPKRVVLADLPIHPGQRVEIVMIAEDDESAARLQELQALFKRTQALPQARALSEEEIAAEIDAYRAGQ